MEFWNELLTRESWEKLVELSKEFDFILIGGWAAYLWTGLHKSKDIDIVVGYDALAKLRSRYSLEKNERLRKYEIKLDKFDIDIYVPFFSRLAVPAEDLARHSTTLKGIKTVSPEVLLLLKQAAELERRDSIKGKKDAIDILTLLARANIDLKLYCALLKKYAHENYLGELARALNEFDERDIPYLNMDFKSFKKWKRETLRELREL